MGREFFGRHFLRRGGGRSRGSRFRGGNGSGISLSFRAVAAEVSLLLAFEAQSLLHQLGSFFVRHFFVDLGYDVHVHGTVILFFPKIPPGFSLVFPWCVSFDDSLHLVVVVVDL